MRIKHTVALLSLGICALPPALQGGEPEFALFVGKRVCFECHATGHAAGPCTLKLIPEHARAFDALGTPPAESIAALSGVPELPPQSRICLDCHATGAELGPRWWSDGFDIEDGVQCEACHGPGSLHVDVYRAPEASPAPGEESFIKRGDQQDCVPCHLPRPSHREVLELGFRLPDSDKLYKTPVNLAVSPDGRRLYVVCEHSDSLIVVEPVRGQVVAEISVGRRPHDVAVSPDGRTVYVTNRLSDTLSVIDAETETVVSEVSVGDDPHGVLVDPTGRHVFVLNTGQNSISVVSTERLAEIRRLPAGGGPWSLALGPDGKQLFVTSVRPDPVRFRDPPRSEVTVVDVEQGLVSARLIADGANMLQGVASVVGGDAVLFTMTRTKNLVPLTRLAQGWAITNGLGVIWPDGRVDQVLLDEPNAAFPDPMDVAVSPDGKRAVVTSGGTNQVAVVDVARLLDTVVRASTRERSEVLPNHLGLSGDFVVKRVSVGGNPRGVAFSPDGRFVYVANALDDSVTVIDASSYQPVGEITLGGPTEITQIRWGERLFHSAEITFGRQFSCRSCHPDGHINGLTFDIEADGIGMHPMDNRTLRGILDTPPFKWEGTNPSLERQCGARLSVFFSRLDPYTSEELAALVRYMCTIERPPNRYRLHDGLTVAQRRGKAIFERTAANDGTPLLPGQRCVHCHHGAHKTSRRNTPLRNTMWFDAPHRLQVFDLHNVEEYGDLGMFYYLETGGAPNVLDVPHLNNVYGSPPYLHNGSARTLEEIWTRFGVVDDHGMTKDLTRQQFNDLISYLKAL